MAWQRVLHLCGSVFLYGGVLWAVVGPWWAMQAAEGAAANSRLMQLLQRGSIPLGALLACLGLGMSWLAARPSKPE